MVALTLTLSLTRPKGGRELVVGRFDAKLLRLLTSEDEGEG